MSTIYSVLAVEIEFVYLVKMLVVYTYKKGDSSDCYIKRNNRTCVVD